MTPRAATSSVAWLLPFLLAAEASACTVPPGRFHVAWVASGEMYARSGKPCSIPFWSAGPVYRIEIVKQPSHGRVSIGSANSVVYQSRAGFKGNDHFTYRYVGFAVQNRPHKSATVEMAVTVK